MSGKLYKLALWYIGKCNSKWENSNKKVVEKLDMLTYKNFGKYMLLYGADAEWRNFSRYDVLDNAIQRLAKYEREEREIRNMAINDFVHFMESEAEKAHAASVFFTIENIRNAAERVKG